MRRDLRSWSLIMRKGRPYSSKARVPTDAMVDELEQALSDNRQRPLGKRDGTSLSREDAKPRACAVQAARDLLFKSDFFCAAEYLLESAAIGDVLSFVSRGGVPNLAGNI